MFTNAKLVIEKSKQNNLIDNNKMIWNCSKGVYNIHFNILIIKKYDNLDLLHCSSSPAIINPGDPPTKTNLATSSFYNCLRKSCCAFQSILSYTLCDFMQFFSVKEKIPKEK